MSSGPSGVGGEKLIPKKYYHLKLTKKDWCIYFKDCPMEDNIGERYCWICKYAKKVDLPHLLHERG